MGFSLLPLAVYFAWQRRARIEGRFTTTEHSRTHPYRTQSGSPTCVGLLGAELFLTRISLIGVIGGVVLVRLGDASTSGDSPFRLRFYS